MTLRELSEGQHFQFVGSNERLIYRGNGWYGWPYSGGPWHDATDREVEPLAHDRIAESLAAALVDVAENGLQRVGEGVQS